MWLWAISLLVMWPRIVSPRNYHTLKQLALPSPYRPSEMCDAGLVKVGVFCRHSSNGLRRYYLSCRHRLADGGTDWWTPGVRVWGDCPYGYLCLRHGPAHRGRWQPSSTWHAQIDCVRSDDFRKQQSDLSRRPTSQMKTQSGQRSPTAERAAQARAPAPAKALQDKGEVRRAKRSTSSSLPISTWRRGQSRAERASHAWKKSYPHELLSGSMQAVQRIARWTMRETSLAQWTSCIDEHVCT